MSSDADRSVPSWVVWVVAIVVVITVAFVAMSTVIFLWPWFVAFKG